MDYRREIDGLRAIAVLPVILFHAGFETFRGGFVGVDIFFVISGYLITSIIVAEIEQGKFSILNFYERRARRILPALFLVMLVCIPFAWFWLLPSNMKEFSQSLISVSLFASNIFYWRHSGYFAAVTELEPLLHTWSLAVEEQYYVLFPLFLMLVWRFGRGWILFLLALIGIISFSLAQWWSIAYPSAAFYLLPTRGWELLIGAFASFYLSKVNRKEFSKILSEISGAIGLILILYSVFFYNQQTPFPGLYALVPTLGAVLIIIFATQQTIVGKFIGNNAFVGIGLISYSAYLWHQPLFAFARRISLKEPNGYIFAVLCLAVLFLAFISWKYVELIFRKKDIVRSKTIFLISISGILFFVGVGFLGYRNEGFDNRYSAYKEIMKQIKWPERFSITNDCRAKYGGDQYCLISNIKSDPTDILIGDSHANHFFPGLSARFEMLGRNLLMFGAGGCPPLVDIDMGYHYVHGAKLKCKERTSEIYQNLLTNNAVRNVFLSFSSEALFDPKLEYIDSRGEIDFSLDRRKAVIDALLRTINIATHHGKVVYVIEDLPDVTFDSFLNCIIRDDDVKKSLSCLELKGQNPLYFSLLEELKLRGVKIVETHHVLKKFPYTDNGEFLYRDGTHLSFSGSVYVAKELDLRD